MIVLTFKSIKVMNSILASIKLDIKIGNILKVHMPKDNNLIVNKDIIITKTIINYNKVVNCYTINFVIIITSSV